MGSYNLTCNLSGKIISSNSEIVIMPITKNKKGSSLGVYSWDLFAPSPMMFEGIYSGYGSLKKTKIFDSKSEITKKEKEKAELVFFNYLKENFNVNDEEIKTIDDFMSIRTSLTRENMKVMFAKSLIDILNNEKTEEEIKVEILKTINNFGFQTKEGMIDFYNKNKDAREDIPVYFICFEKSTLINFLENYGKSKEKYDDEIYSQSLQKQRLGEKKSEETVSFVSGGDFAGANRPAITWKSISNKKNDEIINKLYSQHAIETALINDYLSLLGKNWIPNVTISEDAYYYGHEQAMEMQKILIDDNEKKQNKIIKQINR